MTGSHRDLSAPSRRLHQIRRPERIVLAILFAACVLVPATLLSLPASRLANATGEDWARHIVASALMTTGCAGLFAVARRQWPSTSVLILGGVIVTLTLEVAQAPIATRRFEMDDLTAGCTGVLLVLVTHTLVGRWAGPAALWVAASLTTVMAFVAAAIVLGANPDPVSLGRDVDGCVPDSGDAAALVWLPGRVAPADRCTADSDLRLYEDAGRQLLASAQLTDVRTRLIMGADLELTASFTADAPARSLQRLLSIVDSDGRVLLSVALRSSRLEILTTATRNRFEPMILWTQIEPRAGVEREFSITVSSTGFDLTLDGDLRGTADTAIDPRPIGDGSMRLLVGNLPALTTGFVGEITRVELTTPGG